LADSILNPRNHAYKNTPITTYESKRVSSVTTVMLTCGTFLYLKCF